MSNDVKWTDWRSSDVVTQPHASDTASARTAWLQLLGCVLGLALLAAGLPGPRSLLDYLTGDGTDIGGAYPGASAQAAILATAGVIVWVLLIWSVAVGAAAASGRLPGAPGLTGRWVLRRIAPAGAGRLVAAAVGVSLLAGTSACAAPAFATAGSDSSTTAVSNQVPSTTSVPVGGGSGVVDPASSAGSTIASDALAPTAEGPPVPAVQTTDGVLTSIVIDWPDAAEPPATAATTAGVAAEPTEQSPTGPTPASAAEPSPTAPPDAVTATSPPVGSSEPAPSSDTPPAPAPGPAGAAEASPQPDPTGSTDLTRPETVVVRGGDSLWLIATQHLPPDASDSEIDSAWRAWYSTNQQVIGDNPDLIQPGQQLLPPNQK